jgi:hypothetical protein
MLLEIDNQQIEYFADCRRLVQCQHGVDERAVLPRLLEGRVQRESDASRALHGRLWHQSGRGGHDVPSGPLQTQLHRRPQSDRPGTALLGEFLNTRTLRLRRRARPSISLFRHHGRPGGTDLFDAWDERATLFRMKRLAPSTAL